MKEDSEKENSKENVGENPTISKSSDNKVDEKPTTSKSRENFLKKLDSMFPTRKSEKKDKKVEHLENKSHKDSEEKDKHKDSEDQAQEHDPHAFPMIGDFISSDKLKNLKSGKNNLILVIGIIAGALLIFAGIYLMVVSAGSPERVADNVQFQDTSSFSAFLILAGVLVMGGVLARRFLEKSFFKGINKKLESHNGTSSNSTEKEYKKV
ncbi:hypothetical protein [Methanobacterium sp.]|uniref:hypothetical protein n=1 Tax=Methanobacterium sp. TaxID=2164 RepID=UPI003C76A554